MRFGLHFLAGGLLVYVACSAQAGAGAASAAESSSGSRLKAVRYKGSDGSTALAISMWDSERNELCLFQKASDGVLRCMPVTGPTAGVALTAYVAGTEERE